MRLSDILKKNSQKPQSEEPVLQPAAAQPTPPPQAQTEAEPAGQSTTGDKPTATAEEAYTRAIIEIKNIITCVEKGLPYASSIESVPLIASLIQNGNDEILVLADRATPDIYLYGHCVNLCILSLFLGCGPDFTGDNLLTLGYCAFLCDIGLIKAPPETKKGLPADAAQIKRLIVQVQDMVKNIPGLSGSARSIILDTIAQKQMQRNISEYPEASRGTVMHAIARVIAVTDVYETLTHPRAGRNRLLPHEALKSMIGTQNQEYDSETLKLFLDKISLYPPGSFVRLNSEEIGKVVGLNKGLPTRPKVRVLVDAKNQKTPERKVIDLAATPMIFIKEAVDETTLNLPDKKLSLELKAVRWWVKGL